MASIEAPRDLDPTAFTEILRALWQTHAGVLAAVFVDSFGESVDYCSSVDPFEAKVAAATLLGIMQQCITISEQLALGTGTALSIRCDEREFLVHRVSADYLLVVVAADHVPDAGLRRIMDTTSLALRLEADIAAPAWA